MKIVAISDTHRSEHEITIPLCDILIHAGDTDIVNVLTMKVFCEWFSKQPAVHKIYVAGNHDWFPYQQPSLAQAMFREHNIIYLEDAAVELNGIKFYGSPWTPTFMNWAFMRERGCHIKKVWDQIPDDVQVLITHGPPNGILDVVYRGFVEEHVGCEELLKRIKQLKKLKHHVFGHLHDSYGTHKEHGITFHNCAILDDMYVATNPPTAFEI